MSTLSMTHEAISKALCDNAPLTDDQRAALLTLVMADKRGQELWDTATMWRPIETAPKDGRDLLLWESGSSVPVVASWRDGRRAGWHATTEHYNTDGDACVIDTLWQDGITHWMPIPTPPAAETQAPA